MAARRRNISPAVTKKGTIKKSEEKLQQEKELNEKVAADKIAVLKERHLVPVPLLIAIMICSGALWVLAFRDLCYTGKVIAGSADEAMLEFTKSTKWFDDSKGWKSTQGGFSAVQSVTTDDNDMGGFFVRKVAGAASLAFHMQKLVPFLFQPGFAHWGLGHFSPMLSTSIIGNLAIAWFYASYMEELKAAGAEELSLAIIAVLLLESLVMFGYVLSTLSKKLPILKGEIPVGKSANSLVCKIITRTVTTVSGLITIIAGRDFFFPGQELLFPPRDDIYLEWTGAFIHSPPPGSEEAQEHGLEAPLFVGDKFMSQLMALYLLILCFQKFVCSYLIRVGKDGSGEKKCKLFWRSQAIGDALLTFVLRIFSDSALSASLDLRWHLMCLGYETFILGLYGFA